MRTRRGRHPRDFDYSARIENRLLELASAVLDVPQGSLAPRRRWLGYYSRHATRAWFERPNPSPVSTCSRAWSRDVGRPRFRRTAHEGMVNPRVPNLPGVSRRLMLQPTRDAHLDPLTAHKAWMQGLSEGAKNALFSDGSPPHRSYRHGVGCTELSAVRGSPAPSRPLALGPVRLLRHLGCPL